MRIKSWIEKHKKWLKDNQQSTKHYIQTKLLTAWNPPKSNVI